MEGGDFDDRVDCHALASLRCPIRAMDCRLASLARRAFSPSAANR